MYKSRFRYGIVFLLLILLVGVRFYEHHLFDDGLLAFFQHDYLTQPLPQASVWSVLSVDVLRYIINAIISVVILKTLFNHPNLTQFLGIVYAVVLMILMVSFYYFYTHYVTGSYLGLFYVRRFLIQPLLLFILLPALYYSRRREED